jgi:hypothetical protein
LKIGIHADITAALGGTIAWRELRNALRSYILNRGYLLSLRAGPSASISMATSRASRPPTRLTMPSGPHAQASEEGCRGGDRAGAVTSAAYLASS